jgi:serine/threonine protein kinase
MSPEQVRGLPVDARSDLFSLGTILYEMVSGRRAFGGDTPADTMSAILKDEPPSLADIQQNIPPGLARIVEHSLEKNPADRFQSARDVAFALDAFSGSSSSKVAAISGSGRAGFWQKRPELIAAAAVLAAIVAFLVGRSTVFTAAVPTYHQLTFSVARSTRRASRLMVRRWSMRPRGTESRPNYFPCARAAPSRGRWA